MSEPKLTADQKRVLDSLMVDAPSVSEDDAREYIETETAASNERNDEMNERIRAGDKRSVRTIDRTSGRDVSDVSQDDG